MSALKAIYEAMQDAGEDIELRQLYDLLDSDTDGQEWAL